MQKLKVEDLAQKVSILLHGAAFAMIGKLQMDFNQEMMLQSRVRSWSFIAKTLHWLYEIRSFHHKVQCNLMCFTHLNLVCKEVLPRQCLKFLAILLEKWLFIVSHRTTCCLNMFEPSQALLSARFLTRPSALQTPLALDHFAKLRYTSSSLFYLSNKSSTAAAAYFLQLSSCWFTTSPNIWMLGSCPIASEIAKPSAIRRLFQESAATTAATTRPPPPPPQQQQQQQQQQQTGILTGPDIPKSVVKTTRVARHHFAGLFHVDQW